jgi:hypothetical protein
MSRPKPGPYPDTTAQGWAEGIRVRWSRPGEPRRYRWFVPELANLGHHRTAVGHTWTRWGAHRAARRAIRKKG